MKNLILGSEAMHHVTNSRIDQVTNYAIGKNSTECRSIFKVRGIYEAYDK